MIGVALTHHTGMRRHLLLSTEDQHLLWAFVYGDLFTQEPFGD
jgi:hypothetical protein